MDEQPPPYDEMSFTRPSNGTSNGGNNLTYDSPPSSINPSQFFSQTNTTATDPLLRSQSEPPSPDPTHHGLFRSSTPSPSTQDSQSTQPQTQTPTSSRQRLYQSVPSGLKRPLFDPYWPVPGDLKRPKEQQEAKQTPPSDGGSRYLFGIQPTLFGGQQGQPPLVKSTFDVSGTKQQETTQTMPLEEVKEREKYLGLVMQRIPPPSPEENLLNLMQQHQQAQYQQALHQFTQRQLAQQRHDPDLYKFSTYQDQTTLVLGVLSHIDRLSAEINEMKTFISLGFNTQEDGTGAVGLRRHVEESRLQLRAQNRLLTELDEQLVPLPLRNGTAPGEQKIPTTGRVIKGLDHQAVGILLDLYDIPFTPTMFLHEKKALYLRFVGAGRALMHRVLD
ncbi:hypothetical protein FGG08_006307 [Glutinoglossum americanum]|uniref:Uncharacterized protein n=1 Tax=Glutinoglossum americanum TaxID=1670608 RepID=A0A9P8HWB5_9PEZI|nr:hypothetical protein FGG08_006307 [Glutinoglossum americanum]